MIGILNSRIARASIGLMVLGVVASAAAQSAPAGGFDAIRGPGHVKLGDVAAFDVARGYMFTDDKGANGLLAASGLPGFAAVFQNGGRWYGIFDYEALGHVTLPGTAVDTEAFRRQIESATRSPAESAKIPLPQSVTEWMQPPSLDADRALLSWAVRGPGPRGDLVVYRAELLSRDGVLHFTAIVAPATFGKIRADLDTMLRSVRFAAGQAYQDWQPGSGGGVVELRQLLPIARPSVLPQISRERVTLASAAVAVVLFAAALMVRLRRARSA